MRPAVRPLVGIAASHHLAEDTYEVQSEDFQWKPTYKMVKGKLDGL